MLSVRDRRRFEPPVTAFWGTVRARCTLVGAREQLRVCSSIKIPHLNNKNNPYRLYADLFFFL